MAPMISIAALSSTHRKTRASTSSPAEASHSGETVFEMMVSRWIATAPGTGSAGSDAMATVKRKRPDVECPSAAAVRQATE